MRPPASSNTVSALRELLSKYNTERSPNRHYYFDTVLIQLMLDNPSANSKEYHTGLEQHCGYAIPMSEYPVVRTLQRYRMWKKPLRSEAARFAQAIAPLILDALVTTDEPRRPAKQQAIARQMRGREVLPWEPKAILLVLAERGLQAERSVGAEGVRVFHTLRDVVHRIKLDDARILLNTVVNILAPQAVAVTVDRAMLEMQLRIAQAERESLAQALREQEEASKVEALIEWIRQMNSAESRYALDEVFKNVALVEKLRRMQGITQLPRGIPGLIAATRNFFKVFAKVGVTQYGEVGTTISLTDDVLDEYELDGPPFEPGQERKVEIVGPGWQHRGETILLPRVRRID
jgi:hypothetical protein